MNIKLKCVNSAKLVELEAMGIESRPIDWKYWVTFKLTITYKTFLHYNIFTL